MTAKKKSMTREGRAVRVAREGVQDAREGVQVARAGAHVARERVQVAREADETRKQQIARRLKLSERVLEQYFESKQAEVVDEDELASAAVPRRSERAEVREKRI